MANITIGNYYPENSIIHRLDPRVKLFATLVWIVLLFLTKSFLTYGVLGVYLFLVILLSKVPFSKLLKGLRGIFFIMLFSVLVNVLVTKGQEVFSLGMISVSKEGLLKGGFLALRLVFLVLGTSIMTLTTTPNDLADGMEKGLGFLKVFKVPVHEIAMIIALALRFIPILMEEAEKIKKAQMSRGADFESGNIFRKARNLVPILVPLFISAIRRAMDLATAMEARCYRGGNRTKMKPLRYERRDGFSYGIQVALIALVVGMRFLKVY